MTSIPRVLHVANWPAPLKLFVLPHCRVLREAGAKVDLACQEGPFLDDLRREGFAVHVLPPGSWRCAWHWWRVYRHLRRLLDRERYDLVVAHTPAMSWLARFAARGRVGATVYVAHGLPFMEGQSPLRYHALRWIEKRLSRYTSAVVVMNDADERAARTTRMVQTDGRVFRIPGIGVDLEAWAEPPGPGAIDDLNRRVGLPADAPVVLYLGRFLPDKRPGDVVGLARRIGPAAHVVMAGEGPLWRKVARRAQSVGDHCHVLDFIDDVKPLIHRCAVLVFPSVFREGLPRILLEAQSVGRPVVAYANRGSSDAVADGVSGMLVPPGDVDALTEAVQRLLGDRDLARRMGQAGQELVRSRFDLSCAIPALMEAMRWALQRAGTPLPASPKADST